MFVDVNTIVWRDNLTETSAPEAADHGDGGRRPPAVGRQIRRGRTDRGLTLSRLASASHLNDGYLFQIENAKASPPLACLAAIARLLDVPPAWRRIEHTAAPEVLRGAERRWREILR